MAFFIVELNLKDRSKDLNNQQKLPKEDMGALDSQLIYLFCKIGLLLLR